MAELTKKKCKPCEGGVAPLGQEEAENLLEQVPDWQMDNDVKTILRSWEFKGFKEAIVFVNMVAKLAEDEGHHPNIHIHGYRNVTLTLSTHAIEGLSENDFIVAAKIDALF